MPNRNGTAVDVQSVVRDAQSIAAIQDLTGERLIQFPQVDIIDFQPVLFGTANTGPIPISSGAQPATAMPR